jgi:hypothetical protein
MRINLRRFEDGRHVEPLFNVVSKISLISFVVPIRHLRLPQDGVKAASSCSIKQWRKAAQKIQKIT